MQSRDEGYIKYQLHWEDTVLPEFPGTEQLLEFRDRLKQLGWIGQYPDGTGFGNISIRTGNADSFLISGTQTGGINHLSANGLSWVYQYDLAGNTLFCRGGAKASSEALTHAAMYAADENIRAVIHVHHPYCWKKLLYTITTIDDGIAYGTPEMALEVQQCIQKNKQLQAEKIFVTAGHEDGIFTFGHSLEESFQILSAHLNSDK